MGQPRPGRRKPPASPSDDEDDKTIDVEEILSEIEDGAEGGSKAVTEAKQSSRARRSTARRVTTASSTSSRTAPAVSQMQSSKSAKTKSKSTKQPEPKQANKPIYSFFNAATQRQQSQPSASPEKPRASQEDFLEDILDDISGDDTAVSFSKGSNIALAARKRKHLHDQLDTAGDAGRVVATQKFRKLSDGGKASARPAKEDNRPWTERFAPLDLSELAVHKKKVQDVRNVLEAALSQQATPRLIVLKGPSGSAKTATVNLLANDLGAEIVEWRNPAGTEGSSGASISASAQFEEFILRSGQFAGLQLVTGDNVPIDGSSPESRGHRSQIMVIEEFPNTFARTSTVLQSFRSTIQQFLATPRSYISKPTPLVMIISEALLSTSTASSDSFTAHRLLGPQILSHPQTSVVEFNPVATTILTKALELIVVKEARISGRRKTPGPQVLKHIAETGDIRSAVSALDFLCVKGDEGDVWSAKVAFTKPKGGKRDVPFTKQEQEALKLISNRESSLGIFHAVGKVVYNKRQDPDRPVPQPPTHMPQHRKPKVSEVDVDVLINELGTDTSTFIAALHENYALSCNSATNEDTLDSLNGCIDALSDADLLSLDRFGFGSRAYFGSAQDNLRQDDMSFQTAVRGLLFALPSPVHRGDGAPGRKGDAFRMFYPASLKIWKRKEELEGTLDLVSQSLQNGTAASNHSRPNSTRKDGVESWKRGTHLDAASSAVADQDESSDTLLSNISSSAKTEMLLERLPYAAQIASYTTNISPAMLSKIIDLTSLQGDTPNPSDLQDPDMGEGETLDTLFPADWTDKPDIEDGKGSHRKGFGKEAKKKDMEGGGLHIPVEHAVEKLVLSDDDIED